MTIELFFCFLNGTNALFPADLNHDVLLGKNNDSSCSDDRNTDFHFFVVH